MALSPKRVRQNRILKAFPSSVLESVLGTIEEVSLATRASLFDPDKPMRFVYFPFTGVASVIATSSENPVGVEVATIGHEGMVGLPAFLGSDKTTMTAFMQIPGEVARMKVSTFRSLCTQNEEVNAVLLRYTQAFITQIAQASACNRMHSVDERCARWLLMTHDRVDSDSFPLRQEFLGQMLGVRHGAVSTAAAALQAQGVIRYDNGHIEVLSRKGLEEAACDCYEVIEREYARLLGVNHEGKRS